MSLPSALRLLAGVLGWAVLGAAGADPAPPNTASPGPGAFHEVMATAQTVRQLRAGGYVLYLRHGATDNSRADAWPVVDYADCGSQRVLSEAGRQMAVRGTPWARSSWRVGTEGARVTSAWLCIRRIQRHAAPAAPEPIRPGPCWAR